MIIARLGGIRMPSVPPAASEPAARRGSYFWRCSSGSATPPIEAAVAMLEPLIEAKIAQPITFVCSSRPGMTLTSLARLW